MPMRLFTLLFFPGVVSVAFLRQYHLIQQGKNWNDAQAYCRANFDDLATIETNADITNLQTMSLGISSWIGLYTERSGWRWSLDGEPLGSETQWNPNALLNQNQECTVLTYYSGWWDTLCTYNLSFTCFDDSYVGDSRYITFTSVVTWYEAQSYCRQYHTDLASARNSTENWVILDAMTGNTMYSWIGLFREPWKWSDQSSSSNVPWTPRKPDDALGNEKCAYFYNGEVADAQCSAILPFFCETIVYLRKQQLVSVKVRSSQDLDDPAVKEAILEKIKLKIKEHGLAANTTVKWRERPDGVVFHKERITA